MKIKVTHFVILALFNIGTYGAIQNYFELAKGRHYTQVRKYFDTDSSKFGRISEHDVLNNGDIRNQIKSPAILNLKFGSNHEEIREQIFFISKQLGKLYKHDNLNNYFLEYENVNFLNSSASLKLQFYNDSLNYIHLRFKEKQINELPQLINHYEQINDSIDKIYKNDIYKKNSENSYRYLVNQISNCKVLSYDSLPRTYYYLNNKNKQFDDVSISITGIYYPNKTFKNVNDSCKYQISLFFTNSTIYSNLRSHRLKESESSTYTYIYQN